jgi:transposase
MLDPIAPKLMEKLSSTVARITPRRITKWKAFGLTPKKVKYQLGGKVITSGITRASDEIVRTALNEAAMLA